MALARGRQGSMLFDNLSAFRPCFFHEYFSDFDGDFGVFDENDTYNSIPNKRPHFLFFKRRIRYIHVSLDKFEIRPDPTTGLHGNM